MLSSDQDELNLIQSFYDNSNIDDIKKDQKKDSDLIYAFIAALLLHYTINKEKMDLSIAQKASIFKKATDLINNTFSKKSKNEASKVTDILDATIEKMIDHLNFDPNNSWNLSDKAIKKILDEKIKEKNYSDRIYDNKNEIAKELKKLVKDFLDGKISVNTIKDQLKKKFDLDTFYTDRLVETEISRVCRAVDEQYFKDNNIKEVIYVGILDKKICSHCYENDGKIYNIDDPDRPSLPLHPNCRCFYKIKD